MELPLHPLQLPAGLGLPPPPPVEDFSAAPPHPPPRLVALERRRLPPLPELLGPLAVPHRWEELQRRRPLVDSGPQPRHPLEVPQPPAEVCLGVPRLPQLLDLEAPLVVRHPPLLPCLARHRLRPPSLDLLRRRLPRRSLEVPRQPRRLSLVEALGPRLRRSLGRRPPPRRLLRLLALDPQQPRPSLGLLRPLLRGGCRPQRRVVLRWWDWLPPPKHTWPPSHPTHTSSRPLPAKSSNSSSGPYRPRGRPSKRHRSGRRPPRPPSRRRRSICRRGRLRPGVGPSPSRQPRLRRPDPRPPASVRGEWEEAPLAAVAAPPHGGGTQRLRTVPSALSPPRSTPDPSRRPKHTGTRRPPD